MEPPRYRVEAYRFGSITIAGETYTRDLIICPDGIRTDWWRREGHNLLPEDLEPVLEALPAVLVVGKGAYGRMAVAPQTRQTLEKAGIELITQPTKKACQTYNQLRLQRQVAAALHLTC